MSLDYLVRQRERLVYKNGEFLDNVHTLASLIGEGVGEIIMETAIESKDENLCEKLEVYYKQFIGRCAIENGCYPIVHFKDRHIRAHLHFEPAYSSDGEVFDAAIKKTHDLIKPTNATIVVRVWYMIDVGRTQA